MNIDAKNFILNFDRPECNEYKLAFSCKINKSEIISDRVCIIYIDKPLKLILYILKMLTNNNKIEKWVTEIFRPGKMVIFSFTGNTRKIYIERVKGVRSNDEFFNRSIEWEVGNEDNFVHRNYTLCKQDPDDYKELIPPELNQYLSYDVCLLRNDDNLYIRHKKIDGENVPLTPEIGRSFIKMALNIQENLDEGSKHKNIISLIQWLRLHTRRKAVFNWIQVTNDNMTIYVG